MNFIYQNEQIQKIENFVSYVMNKVKYNSNDNNKNESPLLEIGNKLLLRILNKDDNIDTIYKNS